MQTLTSQAEKLIHLIENIETDRFFDHLWKNSIYLKQEEIQLIMHKAEEVLPKDPRTQARLNFTRGFGHFLTGNSSKMLHELDNCMQKFIEANDDEGVGATHALMSLTYSNIAQLDKAHKHLIIAIEKIKPDGYYKQFLSLGFYRAGENHVMLKDYDQAIRYFTKGLELLGENDTMRARMYNGLANIYMKTGDMNKSLEYFQMSIEIEKNKSNHLLHTRNLSDLGEYYIRLGDVKEAKKCIDQALEIRLEKKMIAQAVTNYQQLADLYYNRKDYPLAQHYAELALQHSEALNIMVKLPAVHEVLYKIYEDTGDLENAFKHYKSFHKYREEIFNQEASRKIQEITMSHDMDMVNREKEIFRLRNVELKSALENIEASITYARRLQQALLPDEKSRNEILGNHFVLYKPKDIVSGDFYWIKKRNDKIFMAAIDCTGHGVPGAIVSVICNNALNRAFSADMIDEPAALLNRVRTYVIDAFGKHDGEVKDGMDISLCAYHPQTRILEFAGANNSVYLVQNGQLTELEPDKQPVGNHPEMKPFTNREIKILEGDILYMFTDGYADQFGGQHGKKFKYAQLKSLLLNNSKLDFHHQLNILDQTFEDWKGDFEQIDDVTLMGVRF